MKLIGQSVALGRAAPEFATDVRAIRNVQ